MRAWFSKKFEGILALQFSEFFNTIGRLLPVQAGYYFSLGGPLRARKRTLRHDHLTVSVKSDVSYYTSPSRRPVWQRLDLAKRLVPSLRHAHGQRIDFEADIQLTGDHDPERPWCGDALHVTVTGYLLKVDDDWHLEDYDAESCEENWPDEIDRHRTAEKPLRNPQLVSGHLQVP